MNISKNKIIQSIVIGISMVLLLSLFRINDFTVLFLADCIFVAGVFLLGFTGLTFVSREGGYDMFGYSFYYVFKGRSKKYNDFKEYKDQKDIKRKKEKFDFSMILVGIIFIIISFII